VGYGNLIPSRVEIVIKLPNLKRNYAEKSGVVEGDIRSQSTSLSYLGIFIVYE